MRHLRFGSVPEVVRAACRHSPVLCLALLLVVTVSSGLCDKHSEHRHRISKQIGGAPERPEWNIFYRFLRHNRDAIRDGNDQVKWEHTDRWCSQIDLFVSGYFWPWICLFIAAHLGVLMRLFSVELSIITAPKKASNLQVYAWQNDKNPQKGESLMVDSGQFLVIKLKCLAVLYRALLQPELGVKKGTIWEKCIVANLVLVFWGLKTSQISIRKKIVLLKRKMQKSSKFCGEKKKNWESFSKGWVVVVHRQSEKSRYIILFLLFHHWGVNALTEPLPSRLLWGFFFSHTEDKPTEPLFQTTKAQIEMKMCGFSVIMGYKWEAEKSQSQHCPPCRKWLTNKLVTSPPSFTCPTHKGLMEDRGRSRILVRGQRSFDPRGWVLSPLNCLKSWGQGGSTGPHGSDRGGPGPKICSK